MKGHNHTRRLWVSLVVMAADQATKLAVEHLTEKEYVRGIIPGIFNVVHRHNPGVACGLLAENGAPWLTPLLIAFSCLAVALLVWLLLGGHAGSPRGALGVALIIGFSLLTIQFVIPSITGPIRGCDRPTSFASAGRLPGRSHRVIGIGDGEDRRAVRAHEHQAGTERHVALRRHREPLPVG